MISTIPVWIILISSLLKIEKTIYQIFGILLSLIGVIAIVTKSDLKVIKGLEFNKGDLIYNYCNVFLSNFFNIAKKKLEVSQITLLQVIIIFD